LFGIANVQHFIDAANFFVNFFCIFAAMDARLFSRIVKELLSRGEDVVLDGFGIFYVEEEPAYFSDKGYTLNPPYRKVCFRNGDIRDDALAKLYAESNGIELPRAKRLIGEYVDTLKEEVFAQKTVVLPDFGRLKVLSKDRVFFIPDSDLAIFPEYDLLEPISLKSLGNFSEASTLPEKPITPEEPETPEEPITPEGPETSEEPITPEEPETPEEPTLPEETITPEEPITPEGPEPPEDPITPEEPILSEASDTSEGPDTPEAPHRKKKTSGWAVFLIIILVLAILFFGGLAVLGRYFPELIDPYLYSAEELELLRKL